MVPSRCARRGGAACDLRASRVYGFDVNSQVAAFAAFAVVAALLTVTPGVDTVLVLRTTVAADGRTGLVAAAGIQTGILAWACAAGLGVAALLAASTTAYTVLKVAGAAYLAGLGLWSLWQAARGHGVVGDSSLAPALSLRRSYSQGLITNLLNPKIGVFYVTLLPQFVVPGQPVLLICLGLVLVHVVLGVLWFLAVTWLATRLGEVLRRRGVRRALDRVTALVFLAFAARLALGQRP